MVIFISTSYDARPEAAVDRVGVPEKATETMVNGRGTTVPVTIEEWLASLCSRAVQAFSMRWTPEASSPAAAGAGAAGTGAADGGVTGTSGFALPGADAAGVAAWLEGAALAEALPAALALGALAEPVADGAALAVADGGAPASACDAVWVALKVIAPANPTATTPATTIPAFADCFIVPSSFP
ncbi:hypothetical protein [Arthrobacter sp. MA-N2]|uniref:hypothetical protein n=1 Tax=Arthrobacter sp. MA-N2 TaxID=1101188 RepID=UPI00047F4D1A|nr:hypothetical protein [Arthrobacter sp. MA-N2]